jgi:hypothetical protein
MRYQVQNSKETASVEFKYNIDGATEKTKLSVYEDGSDERFLKAIKEFQNYIDTYEIWDDNNAAQTVYQNFRRCLAGSARDLWDQINVLEDEEAERDELTFDSHLKELTSVILGEDAQRNQKDYLKYTPKPEKNVSQAMGQSHQEHQFLLTINAAKWTLLLQRRSHR